MEQTKCERHRAHLFAWCWAVRQSWPRTARTWQRRQPTAQSASARGVCCKWENGFRAQEPLTPKPSVVLLKGTSTEGWAPAGRHPPLPASPGNCLAMYRWNGIRFAEVCGQKSPLQIPSIPGMLPAYLRLSLSFFSMELHWPKPVCLMERWTDVFCPSYGFVIPSCKLQVTVHHRETQSKNSSLEPSGRDWNRGHRGALFTGLLGLLCYSAQHTTCSRLISSTVRCAFRNDVSLRQDDKTNTNQEPPLIPRDSSGAIHVLYKRHYVTHAINS